MPTPEIYRDNAVRIIRHGTEAEFLAEDPVLNAREAGLIEDTKEFVFGPGVFSGLARLAISGGSGLPADVYMDEYGNFICGAANILAFPTDRAGELSGIYVSPDSTFTPPPAGVTVTNLRVVGSTLDLSQIGGATTSRVKNVEVIASTLNIQAVGASLYLDDSTFLNVSHAWDPDLEVYRPIGPSGFEYVQISQSRFHSCTLSITDVTGNGATVDNCFVTGSTVRIEGECYDSYIDAQNAAINIISGASTAGFSRCHVIGTPDFQDFLVEETYSYCTIEGDVYRDRFDNVICGSANIAAWNKQENSGRLTNVHVDATATFTPPSYYITYEVEGQPYTAQTMVQIKSVRVTGTSVVDLSGLELNNSFVKNVTFDNATVTATDGGWDVETSGEGANVLTIQDCIFRNGTFTMIHTADCDGCDLDLQGAALDLGGYPATNVVMRGAPANPTTFTGANSGTYYGFGQNTLVD